MKNTYQIKGTVTYDEADTENGFCDFEIDTQINITDSSPQLALDKFLEENTEYQFFGNMIEMNSERNSATFCDINENQFLEIDLLTRH